MNRWTAKKVTETEAIEAACKKTPSDFYVIGGFIKVMDWKVGKHTNRHAHKEYLSLPLSCTRSPQDDSRAVPGDGEGITFVHSFSSSIISLGCLLT